MFDGKKCIATNPAHSPDNNVDIVSLFISEVLSFFRLSRIRIEEARGAVNAAAMPAPAPAAIR